jgi:cytidylate kinase
MSKPRIIAIDGPAASGKTTLGLSLARELGYLYFDTGVMYRAVTLAALGAGVDLADESAVEALARQIEIDVTQPTAEDGRAFTVLLDGKDVTWDLRAPHIDSSVSIPSTYSGVRAAMTDQQRRIAGRGDIVMVGRDIGTVVLPDADLKVYLDASPEARARRRWQEYQANGRPETYEEILAAMKRRDEIDSQRAVAPLRPAFEAVVIDTTSLHATQVLRAVMEQVTRADNQPVSDAREKHHD